MNVKKIGLIAGGGLGSFIVLMVAVYFLFPVINPEKKEELKQLKPETQTSRFNPDKYGPEAVDSLETRVQDLQTEVDSLQNLEAGYLAQIDSLRNHIEQVEQQQQEEVEKQQKAAAQNIEEVSKSLLNLDEDSLVPIVNRLEDEQIIGLYRSGNNMQRSKLLQSLKPEKAATILKKVM